MATTVAVEDGYRHLRATGVRSKHVEHLVERWHAEEIIAGTFKNRIRALRGLAEKIDKRNIVARDNAARFACAATARREPP